VAILRQFAIGDMLTKFCEDWTCSFGDMLAERHTQTDRQTDRHDHHSAALVWRGGAGQGGVIVCLGCCRAVAFLG